MLILFASQVGLLDRLLVVGSEALGVGDVTLGGEFPLATDGCLDVVRPTGIALLLD